ncbi:MAG: YebC/PmpR family DNA-binding transcriptional regulator, partial [Desulfobacterales bacterium]
MELAIDAGAEDVREDGPNFEIIADPRDFEAVKEAIDSRSIPYIVAEITMLPQSSLKIEGKEAEQMIRLMETFEECEDVQKVYTNADIPDEIVEGIE